MTAWLGVAIKLSVLVALGLLAVHGLRRQSAALRHWVLAATVACGLALPALSGIAPQWRGPLAWPTTAGPDSAVDTTAGDFAPRDGRGPGPDATAQAVPLVAAPDLVSRLPVGAAALLGSIWILGFITSALVLITGLARLHWLAAHARAADDPLWHEVAAQLGQQYGLERPIRVLQSDHPALLVTWGWRTPTILLPSAAREWGADRIRVVLAHELAHAARGDWTAQLAAEVLRAIHWFNPVVWVACRRLRIESECACDDSVLAQGIDAPAYAGHLLALARSLQSHRHPALPAPAMARPSSLEGRVRAMLNHTLNRRPASAPARIAVAAGLLAVTLVVAGLQAQAQLYPLRGVAIDPSGRVLPGARVVLTNTSDAAKFEVRTDATGRYEFAGVPPAAYALEASLAGFATLRTAVRIEGATERDLRLRVGTLQETITVNDAPDPSTVPDATAAARREEARRRSSALAERARAGCTGAAASAVGGRIVPPVKLVHATPVFPEHLRTTTMRGTVTMSALIGTDGLVREVDDVQGPHPDLESAAVDAVRRWVFSPTFLNCEPIEVQMRVTTNFVTQ